MRKLFSSITALMLVSVIGGVAFETVASTSFNPVPSSQNYCPEGYICVATNMTAKGYGGASGKDLSGIAVYKKGSDVIAYVPGHGHLRCFWSTSGRTGWHFNANGGVYVILELDKDI